MSNISLQEELEEVNNAITAILRTGSSYSINGQSVTRANLETLLKRKDYLESRIASIKHGGIVKKRPVFEG